MKNLSFHVKGKKLSAAVFYPEEIKKKNPAILFVHGWTSAKERSVQYAEGLAKLGYICFLFDMRGHGESEGEAMSMTNKDFVEDTVAAYDLLAGMENVDKNNISAVGSSFGAYLVPLLSQKRKLKNLILRAPANYSNDKFEVIKKFSNGDEPGVMKWRSEKKKPNETYSLDAVSKFDGKILIMESEFDERIPHQTVENYINAVKNKYNLTHAIIKDAPHSIMDKKFRNEVEDILVNWFSNRER
ncbi:MAG TPA: alpha/beta fold hydrolase [Patescibacteria group bacterium]|nr:alpha/beta fold hydrolase [Patescibacteria group bacterium]